MQPRQRTAAWSRFKDSTVPLSSPSGFRSSLSLSLAAGSLLYWAEGAAQPDKFGSIPRAMWWAIVTLTTVGYGDAFPITPLGKFLAGFIAIMGVMLIALPTGLFAASFTEAMEKERDEDAAEEAAEEVAAVLTGRPPRNPVNPEALQSTKYKVQSSK